MYLARAASQSFETEASMAHQCAVLWLYVVVICAVVKLVELALISEDVHHIAR